ncbi:hypothetical protein D8B26_003851 [Coccidioides posadasii str. Silveira]|uniref:Uncharacterized protein n=1 Tax=Coccidioides posadasii (strain RMSCC 757 / Silveira) TaxID=443226 RepID=E9D947_COCPS|nr:hypothetical protein CPSG_06349 [Coccidioides posadasii str. Silveira]QVM09186.1 hypothetical protein D8B26_003851 [Coccidioides posadasii str. Silveira]
MRGDPPAKPPSMLTLNTPTFDQTHGIQRPPPLDRMSPKPISIPARAQMLPCDDGKSTRVTLAKFWINIAVRDGLCWPKPANSPAQRDLAQVPGNVTVACVGTQSGQHFPEIMSAFLRQLASLQEIRSPE